MKPRKFKLKWQQQIWDLFVREWTSSCFADTYKKLSDELLSARHVLFAATHSQDRRLREKAHKEQVILQMIKYNVEGVPKKFVEDIIRIEFENEGYGEDLINKEQGVIEKQEEINIFKARYKEGIMSYWNIMRQTGMITEDIRTLRNELENGTNLVHI